MNPFRSSIANLDDNNTEKTLYSRNREARQETQESLLLKVPCFRGDITLKQCVSRDDFTDSRNSLIFIARPRFLLNQFAQLQDSIIQILKDHGVPHASVWSTPRENLHMTILDIVSCVSLEQVMDLVPRVSGDLVARVRGRVTLDTPKLMVDGTAMALSFLPSDGESKDSHLAMRRDLWDACHENGTTPVMRYVAHSAHVTLIRFLDDVALTRETMQSLLRQLEELDLQSVRQWRITREDILCVYGQVYYGGGTVLP